MHLRGEILQHDARGSIRASVQPVPEPVQPILVCMSWRGGARFERCLTSIHASAQHFKRIVLSVTSAEDAADMHAAKAFQAQHPNVEVICTGRELPTMEHQAFWIDYLERTGAKSTDWIYWLAYDDEVKTSGIQHLVDEHGNWPLKPGTVYFGPWAMRHEQADALWRGDPQAPLESWTTFPSQGPTRLPLMQWIREQLEQPTYMQMSGSICPLGNFIELRDGKPTKKGPMRIEMAVAASTSTTHVQEFDEPVSVIYGRSNSDRASYGKAAREEDIHLMAWLARYSTHHPSSAPQLAAILVTAFGQQLAQRIRGKNPPQEEWRVRGEVSP